MSSTLLIAAAAGCYLNRRDRITMPKGRYDDVGRWYPNPTEQQDCCDLAPEPSLERPLSLMFHCRNMGHVAKLYNVTVMEIVREVHKLRRQ